LSVLRRRFLAPSHIRTSADYGVTSNIKKALGETQTLRAGCSKAEPKISPRRRTRSRGHRTVKI